MANLTQTDGVIPSGFAEAAREPHAMRMSHAEEGESRGEGWFLLRAVLLLVAVIAVVGYMIG